MTAELPNFTTWTTDRLVEQRKHLSALLVSWAGQSDPLKPQLRAELHAIREEIARRTEDAELEITS
jgi:hypothetical protein